MHNKKKAFIYDHANSQINHYPVSTLQNKIKDNPALIKRMCLNAKLPVHRGCVNTIAWSSNGRYILSGSDDLNLCITDAYTQKVLTTINTGHRSNIFSAKYLPCTEDRHIVSCSGDGGIIYTDIERPETSRCNIFSCHPGTVYDLVTVPNDSNTFFSCGDDSTIRLFDLRTKKSCWTVGDCKEDVLINFSSPVMAITLNQRFPHLLAAGSANGNTYVFDRRMLPAKGITTSDLYPVVKRFYVPLHESGSHRITSVCFSPDGDDILISYSCDSLYLFNMKDEDLNSQELKEKYKPDDSQQDHQKPTIKRVRVRGDWSDTGPNARPESERALNQSYGEIASRSDFILLLSHAVARLYHLRPRSTGSTMDNSVRSSRRRPYPTTHGATGGNPEVEQNPDGLNSSFFSAPSHSQSLSALESRKRESGSNSSSSNDNHPTTSGSFNRTATSSASQDLEMRMENEYTLNQATSSTAHASVSDPIANQLQGTPTDESPNSDLELVVRALDLRSSSNDNANRTGESSNDTLFNRQRWNPNDNQREDLYPTREDDRRRLERSLTNVIRRYKERKNEKWTSLPSPFYKQKYSGHRNARTMIKKANFWGNNYVISGSDCGHIFLWDRYTAELVMILEGDHHVVNCLQPHPYDPVLATSGIDHDIKLWYPTAEESQWDEAKAKEIIGINEVMSREARDTVIVTSTILLRIVTSLVAREYQVDES